MTQAKHRIGFACAIAAALSISSASADEQHLLWVKSNLKGDYKIGLNFKGKSIDLHLHESGSAVKAVRNDNGDLTGLQYGQLLLGLDDLERGSCIGPKESRTVCVELDDFKQETGGTLLIGYQGVEGKLKLMTLDLKRAERGSGPDAWYVLKGESAIESAKAHLAFNLIGLPKGVSWIEYKFLPWKPALQE